MERRRHVAEDRARRRVGQTLRALLVLAVVAAGVWLAFSPLLSVAEVRTAGIAASATHSLLVQSKVRAGIPMLSVRPAEVEATLEQDPWVADARVHLNWPNTVIVRVEERVPVAWVETSDGWSRRALDGHSVPSASVPGPELAWVRIPRVSGNGAETATEVLGAVEFVNALPPQLRPQTQIWQAANGELWSTVNGYRVRLGRPVDMEAKALSLVALMREQPDRSAVLTLVAANHPAITPAGPAVPAGPSDGPGYTTETEPSVEGTEGP